MIKTQDTAPHYEELLILIGSDYEKASTYYYANINNNNVSTIELGLQSL